MTLRISFACAVMLLAGAFPRKADAIGGTSQIAHKGQPVRADPRWPAKLEEFLNQPTRGDGWNSWFSEWPNDVRHYEFEVSDAAQLDTLVEGGVRHAVLGAFGCGAFQNPAIEVAFLYQQELDRRLEHFERVAFAIFDAGYGPDNHSPFAAVFTR